MTKFNDDTEMQIDHFELFDVYGKNLSTNSWIQLFADIYMKAIYWNKPYSGPET